MSLSRERSERKPPEVYNRIIRQKFRLEKFPAWKRLPAQIYQYGYTDSLASKSERIDWDGNGRQFWHECDHITRHVEQHRPTWSREYDPVKEYYGAPFHWEYISEGGYRDVDGGNVYVQYVPDDITSDAGFYVPSDGVYRPWENDPTATAQLDWGTAYEAMMDDAAGLMPSDTSVGVNIAEFSQLRNLVPGISKSITRILNYVRGNPNKTVRRYRYLFDKKTGKRIPWTATLETVKLRSLSWSLRDLASLNLGFNFGVLPLADDVGNWATKLFQLQQHLNWYRTLSTGKSVWVRARTNTVESDERTNYSFGSTPRWTVKRGYYNSATGTLHARVRVTAKSGSAYYNALLAQTLGLNVPMQIAWDLVPFSFVVDWFLPIGKVISRVEPRRALGSLSKSVVVEDTWFSLRGENGYRAEFVGVESNHHSMTWSLTNGGKMEKSATFYHRHRGIPAYNLIPAGKVRFGGKQFFLSLSLFVQRLTKR